MDWFTDWKWLSPPIPSPPCLCGLPPHYLCCASLDGYICVSWMENRNGRLQCCLSPDQSLLT